MVKISVIIPVYNVEKYLEECLDSIINQTFEDIEIICIDDGSTDNSPKILKEYENKDSRLKVLTQDNQGLSSARNHGMKIACGKYIYFIDSDDYLELDALEKLYSISEEENTDLLIFKIINFNDETGKEDRDYSNMPFLLDIGKKTFTYHDFKEKLFSVDVTVYSKFFKKEFIKDMRFPEGLIFEDNLFYITYIIKATRIYFLDECLYHRRIRENSIITNPTEKHLDLIPIHELIKQKLIDEGLYDEFKEKFFMKRIDNIYNRFQNIKPEFKQTYYEKMKHDFLSQKEEYEHEFDLKKITDYYKIIFNSVINSKNYNEIEYLRTIYKLENDIKEIKIKNRKLKKKNKKQKQLNQELLSSTSWKITEPLRKLKRKILWCKYL